MARPTRWARKARIAAVVAAGATSAIDLILDLETDLGRTLGDYTVTRALLVVHTRTVGVLVDSNAGLGLVVMDKNLNDPPRPLSDVEADWMMWEGIVDLHGGWEVAAADFDTNPKTVRFDIRSQRKVRGFTRTVALVMQNGGGVSLEWSFSTQILIKLE